ncbi:MAG TPA: hypothetical protein VHN20_07565, partial [Beijerinckiaceae bacterium]|nr:hypothetical protein [Beijerinckiaceae bacterium]
RRTGEDEAMVNTAPAAGNSANESTTRRGAGAARSGARQPSFFELSQLMAIALFPARQGGTLKCRSQAYPNGPWAADWAPVGTGAYAVMGAGIARDGRVAIAAQTARGNVEYIVEASATNSGKTTGNPGDPRWNPPVDLGTPGGALTQILLGRGAGGRVQVFGLDKNSHVWWAFENPPRMVQRTVTVTPPGTHKPITIPVQELAPPDKPWSAWVELSGQQVTCIALASNADGRIAVFGLAGKGAERAALTYNEQSAAEAASAADWSGWTALAADAALPLKSLATEVDSQGAINVFFIDGTGQVARVRQTPPASRTWSRTSRPGLFNGQFVNVAARIDADRHLMLVATSNSGPVYANQQRSVADAQWSGWAPIMPAANVGELALDYNADGRLTLFARETKTSRSLLATSQVAVNSTEWDAQWTDLGAKGVLAVAVVRDLTPSAP